MKIPTSIKTLISDKQIHRILADTKNGLSIFRKADRDDLQVPVNWDEIEKWILDRFPEAQGKNFFEVTTTDLGHLTYTKSGSGQTILSISKYMRHSTSLEQKIKLGQGTLEIYDYIKLAFSLRSNILVSSQNENSGANLILDLGSHVSSSQKVNVVSTAGAFSDDGDFYYDLNQWIGNEAELVKALKTADQTWILNHNSDFLNEVFNKHFIRFNGLVVFQQAGGVVTSLEILESQLERKPVVNFDFFVSIQRLPDGRRRITELAQKTSDGKLETLVIFRPTRGERGTINGDYAWTGVYPNLFEIAYEGDLSGPLRDLEAALRK